MKKEFKVWEIKNKRWLEQELTSISADGSKVWCCGESYGEDEVIVCYFTGLLDRKGGKIFEGDIVDYISPLDGKRYKATIPDLFSFHWFGELIGDGEEDFIILGNKFENPELAEVKNGGR